MKKNILVEAEAKAILADYILFKWTIYCPIYKPYYRSPITIKKKARVHSTLESVFKILDECKLEITLTKIRELIDSPEFQKMEFDADQSEQSWELKESIAKGQRFASCLKAIRASNEVDVTKAIEKYLTSKVGLKNAQKVSPEYLDLIKDEYCRYELATAADIYRSVNPFLKSKGMSTVTHRRINQIIKQNKHNWDAEKHPEFFIENKRHGHRNRIAAALEQVMVDGSRYSYPYWDSVTKEVKMLSFFILIDVHSRKIIGWSIDASENTLMILDAFRMMVNTHGERMPLNILSDNFSGNYTDQFKNFKRKSELLGVSFRRHKVGNSTDKGSVEYTVHLLERILSVNCPGHVGGDIKHKKKTTRKSETTVSEILKRKNLPNRNFVIDELRTSILAYNNTSYNDQLTANQKFDLAENVGKKLQIQEVSNLFWLSKKITISKSGEINLIVKTQKLSFALSIDDWDKYPTGTQVNVKYDQRDLNEIYCFDSNDHEFLFMCKKAETFNMIPKSDRDHELYSQVYKDNRAFKTRKIANLQVLNSDKSISLIEELKNWKNTSKEELAKSEQAQLQKRFVEQNYLNDEPMITGNDTVIVDQEIITKNRNVKTKLRVL